MNVLGFIGILIALIFLIVGVYRGYHVLPITLCAALIAILFNGANIVTILQDGYLVDFKNFAGNYVIIFLLGAVLGQIISKSGAATKIAITLVERFGDKNAVLMTMIIAAVLSYGGISVFVIVFAIYPISLKLYERANLPQRFIPGNVMLGAGTFVMTALPGSPALTNIIPTNYLGTTATAAPVLGLLTSIFMAIIGYFIYKSFVKYYVAKGECFKEDEHTRRNMDEEQNNKMPSFIKSILPLVVTISIILGERIFKTNIQSSFIIAFALLMGGVAGMILLVDKDRNLKEMLTTSSNNSTLALVNTSSVVGLGGAIKLLPVFQSFVQFALNIKLPMIISAALSVNLISGITGSSSAGVTIFMETMSASFLTTGMNAQVLHRIAAIAAGVFDSLPHAGPNVTFLSISGLSFKEGYPGLFVATCIIPFCGLVFAIILASLGII